MPGPQKMEFRIQNSELGRARLGDFGMSSEK